MKECECGGEIVVRVICDAGIRIWKDDMVQAYTGTEDIREFVCCTDCGKEFDVEIVDANCYMGKESE